MADVLALIMMIISIATVPSSIKDQFMTQYIAEAVGFVLSLLLHIWWYTSATQFVKNKGVAATNQR